MKNLIKILLLTVIISSCEKSAEELNPFNGTRWETPLKKETPVSDTKTKMYIDFISQDSITYGEYGEYDNGNFYDCHKTVGYTFNPETKVANMEFYVAGIIDKTITFTIISETEANVIIVYPLINIEPDFDGIFYLK